VNSFASAKAQEALKAKMQTRKREYRW